MTVRVRQTEALQVECAKAWCGRTTNITTHTSQHQMRAGRPIKPNHHSMCQKDTAAANRHVHSLSTDDRDGVLQPLLFGNLSKLALHGTLFLLRLELLGESRRPVAHMRRRKTKHAKVRSSLSRMGGGGSAWHVTTRTSQLGDATSFLALPRVGAGVVLCDGPACCVARASSSCLVSVG